MTSKLASDGLKLFKRTDENDVIVKVDGMYKSTKEVINLLNKNTKKPFVPPFYLESEDEESLQDDVLRFYYASTTLGRDTIDPGVSTQDLMILYLNMMKRIGDKSAYGVVLESDLNINDAILVKDKFLIKVPINDGDPRNDKDMEIEYYIGLRGVNNVRRLIPNFMFTYSMFDCGTPHLSKSGEVVSFCTDKVIAKYVVIERVPKPLNTDRYFKRCDRQQMITLLLQVALALKMAEEMIGFTHNDLHSGNVLIRDMGENVKVTYMCNNKKYEVASRYQPVIIDYGRSAVNTSYGRIAAATSSNLPSIYPEPHAVGDFFRFMCYAYQYSIGMEDMFQGLYRIFTPLGTLKDNIKLHIRCYHIIPPGNYNLSTIIQYLVDIRTPDTKDSVDFEVFDSKVMVDHLKTLSYRKTVDSVIQYYELRESSITEVELSNEEVVTIADNCILSITEYYEFMINPDKNDDDSKQRSLYYARIIKAYVHLYHYFHKSVIQKNIIILQTEKVKSLFKRVEAYTLEYSD